MKVLVVFSRLFVGLVFIFSGLVKGVDPLGTAYRLDDYFIAFGTEWAMAFSMLLSVGLSALEFALGVVLVLNAKVKSLSWVLFVLMIFFTLLTLNDAINNPVPDCGCFGDAITLTNWQTFYKNLVLIVFVSIIFFTRKQLVSPWSHKGQVSIVVASIVLFGVFEVYNISHLPLIDFRDYKVGNDLSHDRETPPKVYLKYRNISTGEIKEYLSPDYPWNDSVWMTNWEFIDQRIEKPEGLSEEVLRIDDQDGDDYTSYFLGDTGYVFVVVAYDLSITDIQSFGKIKEIEQKGAEDGYALCVVTSSTPIEVEGFRDQYQYDFDYFYADDIVLKTMIRSNPGLILLRDGLILDKWHHNDIPAYKKIISNFMDR